MNDESPQQAELYEVIQKQIGDSHVITKFMLVVEMTDGDDRMLSKMTSSNCTYWDWFGMLQAITQDMVVDWTQVTVEYERDE